MNVTIYSIKKQEETVVEKLHLLHAVLNSVITCEDYYDCVQEDSSHSQARLKSLIHQYFEDGLDCESLSDLGIKIQKSSSEVDPELLNRIRQDVHSLVSIHSDQCFGGRAVARMFHGIASPCFPAEVWGRQHRFWRRYLNVDLTCCVRLPQRNSDDIIMITDYGYSCRSRASHAL